MGLGLRQTQLSLEPEVRRPLAHQPVLPQAVEGGVGLDALAAQVGGLGVAPGVNMSDTLAFFEATHGTAPTIAGQDRANPSSLVLCGAMLLEHIGQPEAAQSIRAALQAAIDAKTVTGDLAAQVEGAKIVSCSEFGKILAAYPALQ